MNHLQTVTEAYDKCGIEYVLRSKWVEHYDGKNKYTYLFLCSARTKMRYEQDDLDFLCRTESFMEFRDGSVASY